MTLALGGVGVSKGVAIGPCLILRRDELEVLEYVIPRSLLDDEVARFESAVKKAKQQLKQIRQQIPAETTPEISTFIDAHLLMIEDEALYGASINLIRTRQCNAEWALKLQRDALVMVFDVMDDPYLKTRRDDIDHVVHRIQRILLSSVEPRQETVTHHPREGVVVARELSPADMLLMYQRGVAAFITEDGGSNSHTAILARSLGVPAVVGLHNVCRYLQHNERVVVDGRHGTVIASPDENTLAFFRRCIEQEKARVTELSVLEGKPAISRDGVAVRLMLNLELMEEIDSTKRLTVDGVGLFRTEMLFMNRSDMPDEEEQFRIYAALVRAFNGRPVTIRTLDLGADKHLNVDQLDQYIGSNPALGLRAIRLCLKEPQLFLPQIRAILRASALGEVRMMVPMISNLQEVVQLHKLVRMSRAILREKGQTCDPEMKVGAMIEVPAAAIAADTFAKALDFLSIGTNDLIQYTLATDRMDSEVGHLYDPLHPAVLRLIKMVIDAGERYGVPVSMCGEMAGDADYTRLLLGLGLKEFSMYASTVLEVKEVITRSNILQLNRDVNALLALHESQEINAALEALNRLD